MKTLFSIVTVAVLLMSTPAAFGQGKQKFGHINSEDLLQMMPERDSAEKALEAEAQTLQKMLIAMNDEYETKVVDYQTNAATWSDLVRQTKEREITDIQTRLQEFQVNADEQLNKKRQELLEPVLDKARKAIKDVSDANGYTYVFDTSLGIVLHYPEGDDILPLVKKQLGL